MQQVQGRRAAVLRGEWLALTSCTRTSCDTPLPLPRACLCAEQACGKTAKTKPRAMQEARKSRPEHFWHHDAHGEEDTDWVVLDLEPEPDAVKEELVKVE